MAHWDLHLWTVRFNKDMDTRSANNSKIDPQVQWSLISLLKTQILFSQPIWKDNKISAVLTKSKQKFIFDSLLDKALWIPRFVSMRPKGLEFPSFRGADRTTKLIHFCTPDIFVNNYTKTVIQRCPKNAYCLRLYWIRNGSRSVYPWIRQKKSPAGIYLFKANNGNTGNSFEISSKLTIRPRLIQARFLMC